MSRCSHCGAETEIHDSSDVSICIECSGRTAKPGPPVIPDVRAILFQDLIAASARARSATDAFSNITGDIPSGIPHPDGTQRIHNASRKLSAAREEMLKAHRRLNDYLNFGIVPEDLR